MPFLVQRILNNWYIHLSNCPATASENLAVATATPSIFFLVSETIILREYIKDLIFIVLGLKGVSPLNWMILWIAPTFNPSIML